MLRTINLGHYQAVDMPSGLHAGGNQVLLVSSRTGKAVYTAYLKSEQSLSEVIYSRLCEKVKIGCVHATYGSNLRYNNKDVSDIISVSRYSPSWTPYSVAIDKSHIYDAKITNPEEVDYHYLLTYLVHKKFWDHEGAGYILEDGYFIKANNGNAFFPIGLQMIRENRAEFDIFYTTSVSSVLDHTKFRPQCRAVISRVANMTDEDIDDCVKIPKLEWRDIALFYFSKRLLEARSTAQRCLEAL